VTAHGGQDIPRLCHILSYSSFPVKANRQETLVLWDRQWWPSIVKKPSHCQPRFRHAYDSVHFLVRKCRTRFCPWKCRCAVDCRYCSAVLGFGCSVQYLSCVGHCFDRAPASQLCSIMPFFGGNVADSSLLTVMGNTIVVALVLRSTSKLVMVC
jgi:hypothetical protein